MLLEVAFFIQLKSQKFSSVTRFIYFLYRRLVSKIECLKWFDFMGGQIYESPLKHANFIIMKCQSAFEIL